MKPFLLTGIVLTSLMARNAFGGIGTGASQPRTLSLENQKIRVVVTVTGGEYREKWFGRDGATWHLVAESGSDRRSGQSIGSAAGSQAIVFTEAEAINAGEARIIELRSGDSAGVVIKRLCLEKDTPFARVSVTMRLLVPQDLSALLSTYSFVPDGRPYASYAPCDFVFTPQLTPAPDDVIADHTFRSPAFILQEGPIAAAVVPDLASIDGTTRPLRSGAELRVNGQRSPSFSFGLLNWQRRKEHVYYTHRDTMVSHVSPGELSYGFALYINGSAPAREAYREIVRYCWETYGIKNFLDPVNPQANPFADYIRKAWYEYVPSVALDTIIHGEPITLLRQQRLAWSNGLPPEANNDTWFNVWFNALRTAYGMYVHGQTSGDSVLMQRAVGVLTLALQAPRTGGLAPTIFYIDSAGGHWVADQAWGGIEGGRYLSMFHNAWTALWMLRWGDLVPARRGAVAEYTRGIADFLVAHQRPSGVIPSWYDPVTAEPHTLLRDENAETAGAALFLADFAGRTGKHKYREAAEKAMGYVLREIVPERKWFDFETFFSCSRKPVGFYDSTTAQHPQNTLSMDMAAAACARLYELTGNRMYRDRGSAILDYLCLYQQVWSPAWLSCRLFGGFGVQNTDGEWSDSRQGYFALTFMKYYDLTGRREYFERGVAALRAMFSLFESPTSPRTAENYGHGAYDALAGVTGLHWGTGSSVVSIHLITQRYGGAFVHLRERWGAGIDGCRIPSVDLDGRTIRITLLDNVNAPRTVKVKFAGMVNTIYNVVVNGHSLGEHDMRSLTRGIDVPI